MHCIEPRLDPPQPGDRRLFGRSLAAGGLWLAAGGSAVLLAGCGTRQPAPAEPAAPATPPRPTTAQGPLAATPPVPPPVSAQAPPTASAPGPAGRPPRYVQLGPATPSRSWDELRTQAARRLVAAHPDTSFMGKPQPLLLAIPVLEVELNGDGSIRNISVLRRPGQAVDTVQLAIDALRRAAPFGDVSRLPRPWKFVETFLFNDDRRFKPRTLDN